MASESFWTRCVEKAIIITARKDLSNAVVCVKSNVICKFGIIGKGSEEVCYRPVKPVPVRTCSSWR